MGYLIRRGSFTSVKQLVQRKQVWLSSLGIVECVAYAASRIKR